MDKIWDSVYRACVEYGQEVADPPHDISHRLDAIVDAYSNAIAAQHEEEVAEMRMQMQLTFTDWANAQQEILGLEDKIAILKAQVVMMAEGVRPLREFLEPIRQLSPQNTTLQERCETFDAVLSAAPRVLYRRQGSIYWAVSGNGVKGDDGTFVIPCQFQQSFGKHGQEVDVLVLAHDQGQECSVKEGCSHAGEQGQDSEQEATNARP